MPGPKARPKWARMDEAIRLAHAFGPVYRVPHKDAPMPKPVEQESYADELYRIYSKLTPSERVKVRNAINSVELEEV